MNQLESLVPIAQAHLDSGLDTEEATKMALVMPVLQVLGYNVFDPSEVIPEYTADIGTRRFEKVDYAVKNGEDLAMIIEVKVLGTDLDRVVPQLARYFGTVECQLGVLTDGETLEILYGP